MNEKLKCLIKGVAELGVAILLLVLSIICLVDPPDGDSTIIPLIGLSPVIIILGVFGFSNFSDAFSKKVSGQQLKKAKEREKEREKERLNKQRQEREMEKANKNWKYERGKGIYYGNNFSNFIPEEKITSFDIRFGSNLRESNYAEVKYNGNKVINLPYSYKRSNEVIAWTSAFQADAMIRWSQTHTTTVEEQEMRNKLVETITKDVSETSKDASVVGRAVAGGIIAGPAGAVVGALSAVDKNNKNRSK